MSTDEGSIAIVGMSGRFPQAPDVDRFWANLRSGVECVIPLSDDEIRACGVDEQVLADSNYVKAAAVLDDVELFDAAFFGFNPREAELMDPQHRIFLETAWEALESAGYAGETYAGAVGVFAGSHTNTYLANNISTHPDLIKALRLPTTLGNTKDYLCTRVSYKLNLTGPSISVQTACSTSLVAVALACEALLNYQCDTALAGGVTVWVPQRAGYRFVPGGILSPDGRCRAFDADAQGCGAGNGVGIVVLRRLADAIQSGDRIRGVIRGWGLNNDGSRKVGFTAPSVEGQARAIAAAHAMADIDPASISYIEAHGTGTPMGDPIEVAALTKVFGAAGDGASCAIGSVKTNIGHLDAAAGVAGLIKTVLAIEHRQLPPSLHFRTPNPQITFAGTPLYVNSALSEWTTAAGVPRRAGVSAFGMGGTNVHLVVEEAPAQNDVARDEDGVQVLPLSARTDEALEATTDRCAAWLGGHPTANLADVAWTLQTGRAAFPVRRCVVAKSPAEAATILQTRDPRRVMSSRSEAEAQTVVFLLPGLGDQYGGMGRQLYERETVFRDEIDRCADILNGSLDLDIRTVMFAADGDRTTPAAASARGGVDFRRMLGRSPRPDGPLDATHIAHPAVFAIDYALGRLWMARGVRPDAMIGYSVGEYAAACLADVLTLEDALTLVVERARLIEALPAGGMIAVPLGAEELAPRVGDGTWIAAVNGPSVTVVAGYRDAVGRLEETLARDAVPCRRLRTSHAFHSPLLDAILEPLSDIAARIPHGAPSIPYLSNVTGGWVEPSMFVDGSYWGRHAAQPVRFADAIAQLADRPAPIFLEVGPGGTLGSLAMQHERLRARRDVVAVASMPAAYDTVADDVCLAEATGRLWLAGVNVAWDAVHGGDSRRRVTLPTYPFERQRYWIDRNNGSSAAPPFRISRKAAIEDWFYLPSWRRTLPALEPAASPKQWLVLASGDAGCAIAAGLAQQGHTVVRLVPGDAFSVQPDGTYRLRPDDLEDYHALFDHLERADSVPDAIAHALLADVTADASLDALQHAGFSSVVALVRCLAERAFTRSLALNVVTAGAASVLGTEALCPAHAMVIGACRVAGQEYPNLSPRVIDLDRSRIRSEVAHVVAELTRPADHTVIAYRHGARWSESFAPVRLEGGAPSALPQHGVFLITGGLGRVGRHVARWLARQGGAIVLVTRTGVPPRDEWPAWLTSEDPTGDRIRVISDIESEGAEVVIEIADVADGPAITGVIDRTVQRYGRLDGVFHAAGLVGEETWRSLSETDAATAKPHLDAKVNGLDALAQAIERHPVPIRVLFSSTATVFGGLGLAAYAAANCYMDAFATARRALGEPWCAIDWDSWRDGTARAWQPGLGASIAGLAMEPDEGIEVLQRVLAQRRLDRIVVSLGDVEARRAQWASTASRPAAHDGALEARHPRPAVRNPYVPPTTETERILVQIWEEVLGVQPVGIFDNFFELGGHSLLGIQVALKIRAAFRVELPVWSLFKAPRVADVAESILRVHLETADDGALAEALSQLESLSDDEAAAHLSVNVTTT